MEEADPFLKEEKIDDTMFDPHWEDWDFKLTALEYAVLFGNTAIVELLQALPATVTRPRCTKKKKERTLKEKEQREREKEN